MTKTKIKSVLFAFLVILGLVFISSTSFAEVAEKGASAGCKTLASRHEELRACILCPLFKVILITDQSIATKAFDALSGGFRNVIVMVLGLVIAYHTLILVSSFTKQDTPKYIGTLLLQTFKVLVAVLLLTNHKYIYDYLINPLMLAGLEFGIALLFNDVGQSVGGVDIEITAREAQYLKNYPIGASATTPALSGAGTYHFSGYGAVIYMRMRKVANIEGETQDVGRTRRARIVLTSIADSLKDISYDEAVALLNVVLENTVTTNMSAAEIMDALDLAMKMKGTPIESIRMPLDGTYEPMPVASMATQQIDFVKNRQALREFLVDPFVLVEDDE